MSQHLVSSIAAVGLATTLTGCCIPFTGGCAGPATTSSPPSTTSEASTTTEQSFPAQACSDGSATCAEYLNHLYYGFSEGKDGPLGVPLRGRTQFNPEEYWFFCEDQCFFRDGSAFADCNVQSSLINSKVMVDATSHTPLYDPDNDGSKAYYAYRVFAIFYEDVAREKLTRCAYQYDGATFVRGNGGCGLGMGGRDCDDPTSAFQGHCPDEGKGDLWANSDECQATQDEWCGSDAMKGRSYPEANCFWKGAAWDSPAAPGSEADLSKLSKANDQLPDMLKQRLESQKDGHTDDGIPYETYWNELVIDGRVLKKLLATEPAKAVAAWAYVVDGNPEAAAEDAQWLEEARKFRDEHASRYGVSVPLVSLNVRANVKNGDKVFGPGPEEATTGAPSESPEQMQFV